MDVRGSFSRLKKKFKHGGKQKWDRTGANPGEERRDPAGPPSSQQGPHVIVDGGHHQADKESDTDGRRIHSMDQSPAQGVPEPVLARRSNDGQERIEGGVDGEEVSQRYSRLHSHIELAVGGSGHKGDKADGEQDKRTHPSPSTPSITLSRKPNGVWM